MATWAQAAPKQHNLVTAVEAMPSTNEQASRSDGTTFWLGACIRVGWKSIP